MRGKGKREETMNEKKPAPEAGVLTAQHLFPPVRFNGFQVSAGQTSLPFSLEGHERKTYLFPHRAVAPSVGAQLLPPAFDPQP